MFWFWCGGLLLVALTFIGFTGQAWEDFFITFKFSRNLAEGHGLTYDGVTPVHGFTSVFNTLVPALVYLLPGAGSWEAALLGYRLLGGLVLAFGVGGFLTATARDPESPPLAGPLLALLLLLEIKFIAFSFNGQEVAWLLAFLALALLAVWRGPARHWRAAGLAFAGLLYTRPDTPVLIAILGLLALVFGPDNRRATFGGLLRAGLLAAALYLPWFFIAWTYFGSPVPHTITAKAATQPGVDLSFLALLARLPAVWAQTLDRVFAPIYFNPRDWPAWVAPFSFLLGLTASLYAFLPVRDRLGRMASLGFLLYTPYLVFLGLIRTQFPWYFAPLIFFGLVAVGRALALLLRSARPWLRLPGLAATLLTLLLLAQIHLQSLWQIRAQQEFAENGVRRPTGEWLAGHVPPGETVYLECLGYIGYFSGSSLLDWPGLASPRVVAANRLTGGGFFATLVHLQPDWLVLRPGEFETFRQSAPAEAAQYRLVHLISRKEAALAVAPPPWIAVDGRLPGLGYVLADAAFLILQRTPARSH